MPEPLRELFDTLLRGDPDDLDAYLLPLIVHKTVDGAIANAHGFMVRFGPTGKARVRDLAKFLALRITDFAIPRSEIARALELDAKKRTQAHANELYQKARTLFVTIHTTGEPGDILLYVLTQAHLGMPQLFCKMPHKTNPAVHCQGADGIHAQLAADGSTALAICFGQSKLKGSHAAAITGCLDDVKPFLCEEGGSNAPQERDLELMRDFLDLDDTKLESAILNYLDPNHPDYLKLKFRGVCLAGFDAGEYAKAPPASEADTHAQLTTRMSEWLSKLATWIVERTPLETVALDVFLIPVPSVQALRDAFLQELGHVN